MAVIDVLVISTGGTITMKPNENGVLVPSKGALPEFLRQLKKAEDETVKDADVFVVKEGDKNIRYEIKEWDTPLDSSDISIDDWSKIANEIKDNYQGYKGFVVLHGTDTMAFTASALSMMFENLNKPIVMTGAQVPIFQSPGDGINNLISAIAVAGSRKIPEVMVYFNHKLMRGNRTMKLSSTNFNAFDTPNYEPLAKMEFDLAMNPSIFRPMSSEADLNMISLKSANVAIVYFFPGITATLIDKMLTGPVEAAILLTYGAGNVPTIPPEIILALKNASERNILIMNITQCSHGTVLPLYVGGHALRENNIIPGFDMTLEACYTKLLYVLTKDWDMKKKREMMEEDLRGELTKSI